MKASLIMRRLITPAGPDLELCRQDQKSWDRITLATDNKKMMDGLLLEWTIFLWLKGCLGLNSKIYR
jgi:hypothetical protein